MHVEKLCRTIGRSSRLSPGHALHRCVLGLILWSVACAPLSGHGWPGPTSPSMRTLSPHPVRSATSQSPPVGAADGDGLPDAVILAGHPPPEPARPAHPRQARLASSHTTEDRDAPPAPPPRGAL